MENLDEQVLGTWVSDENGNPFLRFKEDGRLSGSDGCNGLGGEYTVEDQVVTIDRGASTLKACPGVDDWLRGVTSVTIDGDTMTVMDKSDEKIGELQRDLEHDGEESTE